MPVKVLYILVVIFIDAKSGEKVEEYRGTTPLTYAQCEELLAPDARGPILAKDGKAEIMGCEPIRSDVSI